MTCILFHRGMLACDSMHVLPLSKDETYISPSKVVSFDTPLPFHLAKAPVDAGRGLPFPLDEDIDDRIHGYTLTGSLTHAAKFIDAWKVCRQVLIEDRTEGTERQSEQKVADRMFNRNYHAQQVLGLDSDLVSYTLILIGEKACYRYRSHSGGDAFRVISYEQSHAYGSGTEYIFENYRLYESYAMAMFATALMDRGTGGFIELWKLPTVKEPVLRREAMWVPRTNDQIRTMLRDGMDPSPDLYSPQAARDIAKRYFDAGAFLGQVPEALRRHRELSAEDAHAGETAINLFAGISKESEEARAQFLKEWDEKGWVAKLPTPKKRAIRRGEPSRPAAKAPPKRRKSR